MITMRTDFPCGNGFLIDAHYTADGQYVKYRAETKYNEPQPNWFYFQLSGLKGEVIHFEFANAEQCLDDYGVKGWSDNHPVYRAVNGEWKRIFNVSVEMTERRVHLVTFDVPVEGESMEFAYCFPYSLAQMEETLAECPGLEKTVIGYTTKGREMYRISTNFGDEERSKRGVYVIARQHAAEVSGAWIVDGMMRFLNSEEGRKVTAHQMWWLVPMIDPDAALEGAYGKDQYLGDFNRSWGKPFPRRVELHAIIHDMDRWSEYARPGFFLDMHSPGNDRHGIEMLMKGEMSEEQIEVAKAFNERYNYYLQENNMQQAVIKLTAAGTHNTSSQSGMFGSVYAATKVDTPSTTVETSCWGPLNEAKTYTIDDYHKMGELMVRAMADTIK